MPTPKNKPDLGTNPPAKAQNKPRSTWPDFYRTVCIQLIDNGLGALLILAALIIGLAWTLTLGMNSTDRLTMVTRIVESWAFSLLGWTLAILEAFAFRYIYRARDRTHEVEMKRNTDVKNELMQQKLGFELPSSEPPPK